MRLLVRLEIRFLSAKIIKILFLSNHAEHMEQALFVCSHCRVSSARRTLSRRTQSSSLDHQEYLKVTLVVSTCNVTEVLHFRYTHAYYSQ